jgi:signal transduction histidine kinase
MNLLFYSFTVITILSILGGLLFFLLKKVAHNQLQQIFCINLILLVVTFLFVFLQMQLSTRLNIDPIYFDYLSYIGTVYLPVTILLTSLIFTNTKITFRIRYFLLFIIPTICLAALWTNDLHHLFYKAYSIKLSENVFGLFFYINNIYSYLMYALAILNLIIYFKKNSEIFSTQFNLIVTGTIFPFTINLLGTLGIVQLNIYITPIALAVSLICFAMALLKFQILNNLPISLNKIVNHISDGYVVLNEKNIITNYNETFKQIFNIEHMNIKGSHVFDLLKIEQFGGIDEETLIRALKSVIDSNTTLILNLDFPYIEKFLSLEISGIKSDNVFVGSIILIKDLTQHYKDMELIKSNQDILIEKERLASLGQMIGGIAHNLKTPIFSISGAAEGLTDLINEYRTSIDDKSVTIEDHKAIANDMDEWVGKIKEYLSYMSDVITAVRGQAVTLTNNTDEIFTIEELVKRINILIKHELKAALVTLNVNIQTDKSFEMHGNLNSLVQVLMNILSNAIQSYNGTPDQEINLSIFKENKKLIITIEDHGCGMPESIQEKLFNEMITTKGKKGTGLGMFMSYSNIKAQFDGDIKFTSEEGVGTTFNIILPIKKITK